MRRVLPPALLLLVSSAILGATVFREQVAWAAQLVDANVTNVDKNGNIKVHEQGTARVQEQRLPFMQIRGRAILDGQRTQRFEVAVPDGKVLVIESVSFEVRLPPGQKALATVLTAATDASPNNAAVHYIPLKYQGFLFQKDVYVATEAVTAYASSREGNLAATIDRPEIEGSGDAEFTVSGYLIDA